MDALRSSAALRKALQIGGPIVGTSLAGLLQLASKFSQDNTAVALNVGSGVIALFVVMIAIILAVTDRSAPDAIREAHNSKEALKEVESQHTLAVSNFDAAALEISTLATLHATSIALREFIEPVLAEGPGDATAQGARMAALLDILLSSKQELFGINDERWNFSIYLVDEEQKELHCVACRRRDRADEEAKHRAWPVGVGQIGLAFRDKTEVIVGDVQNPDFEAYFRAPPGLHRSDDGERYRSIAAVPVSAIGSARGVVIATSDVAGRFVPSGARTPGQRDTVEPLRVLAGILVILLAATELHERLGEKDVQL